MTVRWVLRHNDVPVLLAARHRTAVTTLAGAMTVVRAWWGVEQEQLVLSSERA
ncbi:MAG: hypothetical protein ACRDTC_22520 [Pseudonocardiaceae bacterium]